jgi:glycosyltransferase involved in cell wall biosynthesis
VKILLASPTVRPALTGNAATAERWSLGLRARGHECVVTAVPATWTEHDFARVLDETRPDLVHLHHAVRAGRFVDVARGRAAVVVSFAGTDLASESPREVVLRAASSAHVLVAGGEDPEGVVSFLSPSLRARVRGIPKSVLLGNDPFDLRGGIGATPGELLVLLPAGVRAIKGPRFPIVPLERIRASGLPVRYVLLGPIIEPDEGEALERAFAPRPWCSRLEVAPGQVAAALRAADLVLNCSRIEGFSNALAEALACGRAVLASDNPGNRAAVVPGKTAVLYREGDPVDFEEKALSLLRDPERRRALGDAALADAARRFDPDREMAALLAAYRDALEIAAKA